MSADFEIHPESLQRASAGMQRCSDELVTAVETLKARVTGAGSPWGADDSGSIFGDFYTACTRAGYASFQELCDHMTDLSKALTQLHENTAAADDASARGFDRIS
jgi:uncharacterized protein YukE